MDQRPKVIIRHQDGRVTKGFTLDFSPGRPKFHLTPVGENQQMCEILTDSLKAIFYVKSFEGDPRPNHSPSTPTAESMQQPGLKIKVTFKDGEEMLGTCNGYSPDRPGFFMLPTGNDCNNMRVYVVKAATASVETWR
jgi:hypothetical protein